MRLIPTREEIETENLKRCSDFDADCKKVSDPMGCWLGAELGLADGYCPLLQDQQEHLR